MYSIITSETMFLKFRTIQLNQDFWGYFHGFSCHIQQFSPGALDDYGYFPGIENSIHDCFIDPSPLYCFGKKLQNGGHTSVLRWFLCVT